LGLVEGAVKPNTPASLFVHQRFIKNGPGIKACVIGPPEAPAVFIFLPDWQLKQEMDSPFLVFDLIAGNARLEVKGDTRNRIYAKRDHRKKAVGLITGQVRNAGCPSQTRLFICRGFRSSG
jgi:hypothetical protein